MSDDVVLDASGRPLDRIRLERLTVRGFHGVFEHERREGQDFSVDVVLHLDTRPAARTDDLTRTVHYGELAIALADIVRGEPVDLIETLAQRLATQALSDERVHAVDVAVHKPSAPIPETFGDVVVAIRRYRDELLLERVPDRPVRAVLALGTNLGDRVAQLRSAVADLAAVDGLDVVGVSPVVETAPVGGPPQPDYLNAVVQVDCALSAHGLLDACQEVEAALGRQRLVRWGARTLDVDVIVYGDLVAAGPRLELPHPRAGVRAFVLAPWSLLDPNAVLPLPQGPVRVVDLLSVAEDRDGVRTVPGLGLR